MLGRLTLFSLSLLLLLLVGNFKSEVYAGRIDLDNTASTSSTQLPAATIYLDQFSRFSANGTLENQGFAPGSCSGPLFSVLTCGPTQVHVYSLSDYGITSGNLNQAGNLLQIQFRIQFGGGSVQGGSSVSVFLIDPADLTTKIMLSAKNMPLAPNTFTTLLFNLGDFGPLPLNINPNFYIGLAGGISVGGSGQSGLGSSVSILSTVSTPEPATISLLLSGLASSGMIWRRRRRRKI